MSEHLLLFPDRETAEEIADDLVAEGFDDVRIVRVAHAGEDDAEDHEWAVHLHDRIDGDDPDADGLRSRFAALAADHDGWYDPDPGGY